MFDLCIFLNCEYCRYIGWLLRPSSQPALKSALGSSFLNLYLRWYGRKLLLLVSSFSMFLLHPKFFKLERASLVCRGRAARWKVWCLDSRGRTSQRESIRVAQSVASSHYTAFWFIYTVNLPLFWKARREPKVQTAARHFSCAGPRVKFGLNLHCRSITNRSRGLSSLLL